MSLLIYLQNLQPIILRTPLFDPGILIDFWVCTRWSNEKVAPSIMTLLTVVQTKNKQQTQRFQEKIIFSSNTLLLLHIYGVIIKAETTSNFISVNLRSVCWKIQ